MRKNLIKQRFGRLIVLQDTGKRDINGRVIWLCRCDCGIEKEISACSLLRRKHNTVSCGCWTIELGRIKNTKHGYSTRRVKSPEYHSWTNMKTRCINSNHDNYKWYGGRGITIYTPWLDFQTFLQYLKDNNLYPRPKGMSIDRIDNEYGYFPNNIRWATQTEQVANRRPPNRAPKKKDSL